MDQAAMIERMKKFWDTYADSYERHFQEKITDTLFRLCLPLLSLETTSSVLEAGCGSGKSLRTLRSILPPEVKIYCNDISQAMVAKTQSKGIENVEVVVASNDNLPFSDGCCNKYIANLSLHLVPNPAQMLRESFRVLQSGGVAVFSVPGKTEDSNFLVVSRKALNRAGIPAPPGKGPFCMSDCDELNKMLADTGFTEIRSFYTAVGTNISNGDEFVEMMRGMPGMLTPDNQEKNNEIMQFMREEAEKVLQSGRAITLDALIASGKKP